MSAPPFAQTSSMLGSVQDRMLEMRDRLLTNPRFQRWAARFPLTRPIARRPAGVALVDAKRGEQRLIHGLLVAENHGKRAPEQTLDLFHQQDTLEQGLKEDRHVLAGQDAHRSPRLHDDYGVVPAVAQEVDGSQEIIIDNGQLQL